MNDYLDKILKWLWVPLLIVLLALCTYFAVDNWHSISTITMIDRGGYLYDDNGQVTGLWDGSTTRDIPTWLLSLAIPWYMFANSPLWFKVVYLIVGFILTYLYVLPHIRSKEETK